MEGKLIVLLSFAALFTAVAAHTPFTVVLFMCVWKRPVLTHFVLNHYANMRQPLLTHNVRLDLFVVASDNATATDLAAKYDAAHVVVPNFPLGAKHNRGLLALRQQYSAHNGGASTPEAVAVVGSDDLLNEAFFIRIKQLMQPGPNRMHIVGLQDLFFFDLHSQRILYTQGYRHVHIPVSGTIGCGRVFSWAMLNTLQWNLWDSQRNHSLDQSAIRRVLTVLPQAADISTSFRGHPDGIVAIDIKTDAFEEGTNIWRFDDILHHATSGDGPMHDFVEENPEKLFDSIFGYGYYDTRITTLRDLMLASSRQLN